MANNTRIEIEITEDNREAFKKATKEQIDIALKAVGAEIERNASDKAPEDTGFLRLIKGNFSYTLPTIFVNHLW